MPQYKEADQQYNIGDQM